MPLFPAWGIDREINEEIWNRNAPEHSYGYSTRFFRRSAFPGFWWKFIPFWTWKTSPNVLLPSVIVGDWVFIWYSNSVFLFLFIWGLGMKMLSGEENISCRWDCSRSSWNKSNQTDISGKGGFSLCILSQDQKNPYICSVWNVMVNDYS